METSVLEPTNVPSVEPTEVFDYDDNDSALARALDQARVESEAYFDDPENFNLSKVRETNTKLWMGKHWDNVDLYSHELPYVDNRVFMATEAVVSHVTGEIAQPEAIPEGDSQTSVRMAEDLELYLLQAMRDERMSEKSKIAARFVYLMRNAFYKVTFDPNKGSNGKIVISVPDPRKVIVDHRAKLGENPRFIAELMSATGGELMSRFPQKEKEILAKLGYQRKVQGAIDKHVNYWEYWFTLTKDGKSTEKVGWTLDGCLMGKMDNVNWNKDGKNYFDSPQKPYIPINYLTFGTHWVDNVSAIEQVWWQQAGINRRGFQVNQNADEANGHVIISKKAMQSADAQNITGDPKERILVDADDVTKAFTIVGGQMLPQYVVDQMTLMQRNIDDVLGTPSIFRGGDSKNNTLGQDMIVKDQSYGRHDPLVKALDSAHERLYEHFTQMMMVWYDEEHFIRVRGEDGKFLKIAMSNNRIEPSVGISVIGGSGVPIDKGRKAQIFLKLGQLGFITNPYLMFEGLDLPNANKLAQQELEYRTDPASTVRSLKTEEYDRLAFADILQLLDGKEPKVRDEITPEYINYFRKFMMSGDYRPLDDKIKQAFTIFVTLSLQVMDEQLAMEQTQIDQPDPNAIDQQGMLPAAANALGQQSGTPQPNMIAPQAPQATSMPAV